MIRKLRLLALLVVVLLGATLVLGGLILVVSGYYYSHFTPQNILIVSSNPERTQDLVLMRHLPQDEKVIILTVESQIPVELIGGYDEYQVRSIYPLLQMDGRPAEFITAALAQALGVVVDQIWVLDEVPDLSEAGRLQNSLDLIIKAEHQNWSQKLFFLGFLIKYRTNQLAVEQRHLTELPVQAASLNLVESNQVIASQCAVGVVNATTVNKLGKRYSQFLEQNGFRVVRVTDSAQAWPQSTLIERSQLPGCQAAVARILTTLPSRRTQLDSELADYHRADVVVILGQDFE